MTPPRGPDKKPRKRSEKRRRRYMLMVRLTEEEERKIEGDAARALLAKSDYVRRRLGL
jgi:hypothetical protein